VRIAWTPIVKTVSTIIRCYPKIKHRKEVFSMSKRLSEWIFELGSQFNKNELGKQVLRAKITIGLTDPVSKEIQYHVLDYTSKTNGKNRIIMEGGNDYVSTSNKG
jgi:hypothetical protein